MFCSNCGSQIDDGSVFCPNCGARVAAQPVQAPVMNDFGAAPAPNPVQPKKKLNIGALIGIIGGGVAAVALALILIFTLGTRSLESTVKQSFEAVRDLDAKKVVDVAFPDKVLDYAEEEKDLSKKDIIDEMQDLLDELKEFDDYKDFKKSAKYKIKDTESLKKKEIKQLNENYDKEFDTGTKYISDAANVTIKVTSKVYDDLEITLRYIKVGGKWYFDITQRIPYVGYLNF